MSGKSEIEWTETRYYVTTEHRWKVYRRKCTDRPGRTERRRQAAAGSRWCRGCKSWLTYSLVSKNGVCREHANAEYRSNYAKNPGSIRTRTGKRKRDVDKVGRLTQEYLMDQCGGRCVYCGAAAETCDHIIPVSQGGQTIPGNVAPACLKCNSSKRDAEVFEWLKRTGRVPSLDLADLIILGEVI